MINVLHFFPKTITEQLAAIPPMQLSGMEEIRIRVQRPIEVILKGKPIFIPYIVQQEDAAQLLNKISQYSIYTLEEELRRGYITIEGGHRVGLAGKVILDQGKVKAIRDISSFNIRIAREKIGIAEPFLPYLYDREWKHTMVIGPPQSGKTTLLRDIARMISTGIEKNQISPLKVGIVDERSEIAGSMKGVPQLSFGPRIDVLDACPKAEGMMMLIRSMSPDVLVVDEIGRLEDVEAIMEAVYAGIKLITTVHGRSLNEVKNRPSLVKLTNEGVFERYLELNRANGPGTISSIRNRDGINILNKVRVT